MQIGITSISLEFHGYSFSRWSHHASEGVVASNSEYQEKSIIRFILLVLLEGMFNFDTLLSTPFFLGILQVEGTSKQAPAPSYQFTLAHRSKITSTTPLYSIAPNPAIPSITNKATPTFDTPFSSNTLTLPAAPVGLALGSPVLSGSLSPSPVSSGPSPSLVAVAVAVVFPLHWIQPGWMPAFSKHCDRSCTDWPMLRHHFPQSPAKSCTSASLQQDSILSSMSSGRPSGVRKVTAQAMSWVGNSERAPLLQVPAVEEGRAEERAVDAMMIGLGLRRVLDGTAVMEDMGGLGVTAVVDVAGGRGMKLTMGAARQLFGAFFWGEDVLGMMAVLVYRLTYYPVNGSGTVFASSILVSRVCPVLLSRASRYNK